MAIEDGDGGGTEPIAAAAALTPGEPVEVYFWSKREWRAGRYFVDACGGAFVAFPGAPPLRFEAARLMGLRRLLQ